METSKSEDTNCEFAIDDEVRCISYLGGPGGWESEYVGMSGKIKYTGKYAMATMNRKNGRFIKPTLVAFRSDELEKITRPNKTKQTEEESSK